MIANPANMIRGNTRAGSRVSSAMFTESSNPTKAKKARAVAAVIERTGLSPGEVST